MNNILVVNVNWIGDVVFSSPIFRALKQKYPHAKISCLAVPRAVPVLECIEGIDEIIIFDEDGKHRNIFSKLALIGKIKQKKFDIVFLLHRSWTRAFLVKLAGIPIRVGYDEKNLGNLLTHKVEKIENIHRSDHYIRVVESYGIPVEDRQCILNVSSEAQQVAEKILLQNGIKSSDPFVVVNTGGNWDLKRWPLENFKNVITEILKEGECKIILSGADKDVDQAEQIRKNFPKNVVNLCGKTNLPELMAIFQKARCVISNDSGPVHLANAVGTKVIVVFGPTIPQITGPRGSGSSFVLRQDVGCNKEACYHLDCLNNVCMQAVTAGDVVDAYRQIKSS